MTLGQSPFLSSFYFFFFLGVYLEIKMFILATEVIKKEGVPVSRIELSVQCLNLSL